MAPMSQEIDAFLAAYKPRYICFPCLAKVTAREPADVKQAVDALIRRAAGGDASERVPELQRHSICRATPLTR